MAAVTQDTLVAAIATEFGGALAALAGVSAVPEKVTSGGHAGWIASIGCEGSLLGRIVLGISDDDLRRACSLVMGMAPSEVGDDVALDTLRELTQQAVGAIAASELGSSVTLTIADALKADSPELEAHHAFAFTLPDDFSPHVFVRADLEAQAVAAPETRQPAAPDLPQVPAASTKNLDVLLDIELPVSVRFGKTELPLLSLVRLGPGSVIDLHRSADEPVEVMVSGKVIARGEVVVVQGNYGVRVTEIVSRTERIRSMGA